MKRGPAVFLGVLLVTLLIAAGVSQFASDQPDGLERVAEEQGFSDTAEEHLLADAPLAGYGENGGIGLAVAGFVGVAITLGLGYGVFWLARSRRERTAQDE